MAALTRRRVLVVASAAALVGGGATVLAVALAPARALAAYLVAFAFATTIAVGALIFLQIAYVTGARWAAVIRRLLEHVAAAVTPLAILFVPLAAGAAWLWPWTDPAALPPHEREKVVEKLAYLDHGFFVVRAAIYFAIWIAVAEILRRRSRRRDRGGPRRDDALAPDRSLSAAALPAVALAITFAGFDWIMSLQPAWYSTMFGVYVFAGGFVAAIALVAALAAAARRDPEAAARLTPHHFHALGRLLLAFVVFWAYTAYFQLFLIAIANKPDEVTFYVVRLAGGWRWIAWVLGLGHFAVPLLLLLPRDWKLRPRFVAAIGAWLVAMHYVDLYWAILPAIDPRFAPHWADLAALLAVGGAVVAVAAARARGVPLVALGDPLLDEGARYRSPAL